MKLDQDELKALVAQAQTISSAFCTLKQCYALTDLTCLSDRQNEQAVLALCDQVNILPYSIAAVCIYPSFIKRVCQELNDKKIKIATVCNFPSGNNPSNDVQIEIEQALMDGADEIDLVMPYQDYLQEQKQKTIDFITKAKQICRQKTLKVILETGAFDSPELLFQAARDIITAGADFLKTSTGKVAIGATASSAFILMKAIQTTKPSVGFKASGGIRTLEQANTYLVLAELLLGPGFIQPESFRFGSSQGWAG